MKIASLILPNQLFQPHPAIKENALVLLVEDPLFFKDARYPVAFHKQKLIFHRATMKNFELTLKKKGYSTLYFEAGTFEYTSLLRKLKIDKLIFADPVDAIALQRILRACKDAGIETEVFPTPNFLLSQSWIERYFHKKTHFAFTPFYVSLRKEFGILLTNDGKPLGGKWTYDLDNRQKLPKGVPIPELEPIHQTDCLIEAKDYVKKHFGSNLGQMNSFIYPTTHSESHECLKKFLNERLALFGTYQDAIVDQELVLMHSVLSPMLNVGLITPRQVLEETLIYANHYSVPINSLEGFLRQVIGWREFVRAVYCLAHVRQRKHNFWNHTRKIPASFYTGTTGILPIDATIQKLQKNAYCHHIERLMVLGSFMLLCEFDPDEVYRWFMEFFIDAYDWVMVPNVYGMSQYADGGLMTTKPYICSSAYIRKMSNYPAGEWCDIWDGLFWRFMAKHAAFFSKQPRLGLLCKQLPRVDQSKLAKAEAFLQQLEV